MYRWIVFLHVVGVFGFLLAHGASAVVGFTLRGERSRERIRAQLDLSAAARTLMYWSLGLLLAAGVTAGFLGRWWGRGWIWAALALLALIVALVVVVGSAYFRRLRQAVSESSPVSPASDAELAELLASPRPRVLSVAGTALLVIILYLMMFKPF